MNDLSKLQDELKNAGAHFGYSKSRRHPSASLYIKETKGRTDIFDVEKTAKLLQASIDFLKSAMASGKKILFVGGKPEVRDFVKSVAIELNQPYVVGRWIGGTITNFAEIKKRIKRMKELEEQINNNELSKYTKKEQLQFKRELNRLQLMFEGLSNMDELPGALFIVDPGYEKIATKEARQIGIKIVGLASSDNNFNLIDFPIPANDTAKSSVSFLMSYINSNLKS